MRCLAPWLRWAFAARFDATTERYLDAAGLATLEQRTFMGDGVTMRILAPAEGPDGSRSIA
jgi:hypothetical protein